MDDKFAAFLRTLKTKTDCQLARKSVLVDSKEKQAAVDEIRECFEKLERTLAKHSPPQWVRAGIIGDINYEKGRFGIIFRDKKGLAPSVVEYVSEPHTLDDDKTHEVFFYVCRLFLWPVTYSGGALRVHGRGPIGWLYDAARSSGTIISLTCGNLIERAKVYVCNELPLTDEHFPGGDFNEDAVRARWVQECGDTLEGPPMYVTLADLRKRLSSPLYSTWQDWPPDRDLIPVEYRGDPHSLIEDDPNEEYNWDDRIPGLYLAERHDDDDRFIVDGPFESMEQAREWAWQEYHNNPGDVPR